MDKLAVKILKSKYFIWPLLTATVIICSISTFYYSIEQITIYPDLKAYTYEYYTDEANGGNSEVLEFIASDSIINLTFDLKNGFYSPYVGLSISPKMQSYIDARKYNQISLKITGKGIDRIGISIFTPPPRAEDSDNQNETLYHSIVNISGEPKAYIIPVKQLKHPEWWAETHNLDETKTDEPDLSKVLHINIGSAFTPIVDSPKTLEIYSIAFTRNNKHLFIILGIIFLISVLLLFIINYFIALKTIKTTSLIVSYKPIEVAKETVSDEKYLEFINQNFHNSELNLELVSRETGITQRRITNAINDAFQCNFKTYINRIRITEAKRLLTQSELNIGEISFKVGFNNQSHFNRVFKTETGISPSQYREKTN